MVNTHTQHNSTIPGAGLAGVCPADSAPFVLCNVQSDTHPGAAPALPDAPAAGRGGGSLGNVAITGRDIPSNLSSLSDYSLQSLKNSLVVQDHCKRSLNPRAKVLPGGLVVKHLKGCSIVPEHNGLRGEINGFSLDSRRRLRIKLMSVDFQALDWLWVTLTYHHGFSDDPDQWKAELQAWIKRLTRNWSSYQGLVWRLEFQRRGAPHFHLLIGFNRGGAPKSAVFSAWCRFAWAEIINGTDDKHLLKHSCRVVSVCNNSNMGALLGYLVNELGKVQQNMRVDKMTGEILPTGRVWGVRGDIPMLEIADVEFADEVEFTKFCERCNARSRHEGDIFDKISPQWSGFVLMGDGLDMLDLLQGLNYTFRRDNEYPE